MSSLTLPDEDFAPASQDDMAATLRNYETPMGRYLGSKVSEGWFNTVIRQATEPRPPGNILERERVPGQESLSGVKYLTEDEWKQSPNFREGLPFQQFSTDGYARHRAEVFDDKTYRDWLISQRQNGVVGNTLGFGAAMLGGLPDPVNYVPLGFAGRAALAVKATGVLGKRVVPSFLGHGAEAGLATAATEPVLIANLQQWGDDFTFADIVTDIALGAATGGVLGAGIDVVRARAERARAARESAVLPENATATPLAPDAAAPIPAKQHAEGSDALTVAVSDLVNNREPSGMARTVDPNVHLSPDAPRTPAEAAPPATAAIPEAKPIEATAAEGATPETAVAGPETRPATGKPQREVSEAEEEYEGLVRGGAVKDDVRAEYEIAAKDADRIEQGIDSGYERALTCLRNGELD